MKKTEDWFKADRSKCSIMGYANYLMQRFAGGLLLPVNRLYLSKAARWVVRTDGYRKEIETGAAIKATAGIKAVKALGGFAYYSFPSKLGAWNISGRYSPG